MDSNPQITVVIALRNEMGYIQKCNESLLQQTLPDEMYEILVYDGDSSDGSLEYLKTVAAEHANVHLFNNPRRVGAAGWNEGFRRSNAKYVVMMGGHTYVAPDFLERNYQHMERETEVPCSGGAVHSLGEDAKSKAIALAFNHPFGAGNARYRYGTEKAYVETINYGMYRKSVVDAVGPVNEDIRRGEDWEYNYQVTQKFGRMLFDPEIKSYYFSRSNFKALWKRQYDAGKYKLEIIRKFPGSMLFRHVIPFVFAMLFLLMPLFLLTPVPPVIVAGFYLGYAITALFSGIHMTGWRRIQLLQYVIYAFFLIQFSYGLGFAVGILRLLSGRAR